MVKSIRSIDSDGFVELVKPLIAVESVISRISRVSQKRHLNHFDSRKQNVKEICTAS